MICSLWKIEFVTASATYVLLDYVDKVTSDPEFPWEQQTAVTAPIFQKFASSYPLGGVQPTTVWTRVRRVNRPRTLALTEANNFPWGTTGYMRITIQDGGAFVYLRSAVKGISPTFDLVANYLLQAYQAELGPPSNPAFSTVSLLHAARSVGAAGDIYAPTVSGGLAAYACSVFAGALPPGYSLTTSGASCGKITGTPTTAGVYEWTLALTDARGARALYEFTITINA